MAAPKRCAVSPNTARRPWWPSTVCLIWAQFIYHPELRLFSLLVTFRREVQHSIWDIGVGITLARTIFSCMLALTKIFLIRLISGRIAIFPLPLEDEALMKAYPRSVSSPTALQTFAHLPNELAVKNIWRLADVFLILLISELIAIFPLPLKDEALVKAHPPSVSSPTALQTFAHLPNELAVKNISRLADVAHILKTQNTSTVRIGEKSHCSNLVSQDGKHESPSALLPCI